MKVEFLDNFPKSFKNRRGEFDRFTKMKKTLICLHGPMINYYNGRQAFCVCLQNKDESRKKPERKRREKVCRKTEERVLFIQ